MERDRGKNRERPDKRPRGGGFDELGDMLSWLFGGQLDPPDPSDPPKR